MQVSVVVAVFNSASTLRSLVDGVIFGMNEIASDYELILVNDGSLDSSWQVIKELAHRNKQILPINLSRNYSEHNATLCGIRAAKYHITVTLDDDLQNPPSEIGRLLRKLEEGYDVVYGSPKEEQHGLFRDLASQLTKIAMQQAMGVEVARSISSFRAFRTRLRDGFASFNGEYPNIDVLLTWSAASYGMVKVEHLPRTVGSSTYNLERLVRHALNMITGFSMVPLQLATIGGAMCMSTGFIVLGSAIVQWIARANIAIDAPFLAGVILIFLSCLLVGLGIAGEYLGRIYAWTIKKPTYLIKNVGVIDDEQSGSRESGNQLSVEYLAKGEKVGARK